MKSKVILQSEWLDQTKMGDPMKGRVVLLEWLDVHDKTFQHSVNEQWFEGTIEEANKTRSPNYAYGEYFNGETVLTQQMLATFYRKANSLFSIHL